MYDTYWPINPFVEGPSKVPILREAFSDWKLDKGIFDCLETLYDVPWEESAESSVLNYEYFGNRSGGKLVAPVVLNVLGESESLSDADRALLASIIWTKFKEPWTRLWETNIVAYNPIHNYNMTDVRQLARGDSSSSISSSETSQSTEHGKTDETTEFTYGLNTSDDYGKRANRQTSEECGETVVSTEDSRSTDGVSAREETETTNRSGNIGVTTTQQMLSAERELWLWNFFDQVYKDIDSVLSLPFYDPCRV